MQETKKQKIIERKKKLLQRKIQQQETTHPNFVKRQNEEMSTGDTGDGPRIERLFSCSGFHSLFSAKVIELYNSIIQ